MHTKAPACGFCGGFVIPCGLKTHIPNKHAKQRKGKVGLSRNREDQKKTCGNLCVFVCLRLLNCNPLFVFLFIDGFCGLLACWLVCWFRYCVQYNSVWSIHELYVQCVVCGWALSLEATPVSSVLITDAMQGRNALRVKRTATKPCFRVGSKAWLTICTSYHSIWHCSCLVTASLLLPLPVLRQASALDFLPHLWPSLTINHGRHGLRISNDGSLAHSHMWESAADCGNHYPPRHGLVVFKNHVWCVAVSVCVIVCFLSVWLLLVAICLFVFACVCVVLHVFPFGLMLAENPCCFEELIITFRVSFGDIRYNDTFGSEGSCDSLPLCGCGCFAKRVLCQHTMMGIV